MRKADEMFEKLGYAINEYIDYINYENLKYETIISFDKEYQLLRINNNSINILELQAINEKCKELGWLDE